MASPSSTIFRLVIGTIPFGAALIYLLYKASQRGYNDNNQDVAFSLLDTTIVFLCCHVVSTLFAVHLLVFLPKRRHLLGRYLREGETTLGDVVFDKPAKKISAYCCRSIPDYGYAIYPHPTKINPSVVVRKHVRVYQPYTRERISILRLKGRPLSGQAKIDIEIDLSQMRTERDSTFRYGAAVSIFWVMFSLAGAAFCTYQMGSIGDGFLVGNENAKLARRILLIVVAVNPFFVFAVNGIRFLLYNNWMVSGGATVENEGDARTIQYCCLKDDVVSADGSDLIPYSILGDNQSYAGTLPSHNRSINTNKNTTTGDASSSGIASGKQSHLTVSSNEEGGSAIRMLPFENAVV